MSPEPKAGELASNVSTAEALRRRFDESFASVAGSGAELAEDMLAIRLGTDSLAVRLSQITGLSGDLKIVPIPSPVISLLGIVAVRGLMAPIYDLGLILGYPPVANPRWTVFVRAPQTVGLAFGTFESHLKVSAGSISGETVRAGGALRPIIDMPSVVAKLKEQIS